MNSISHETYLLYFKTGFSKPKPVTKFENG